MAGTKLAVQTSSPKGVIGTPIQLELPHGGMQQHAGDALVTLDDHVGLDVDGFAEHALHRRTAAVDGRTDLLDECPAASVLWPFHVDSTTT